MPANLREPKFLNHVRVFIVIYQIIWTNAYMQSAYFKKSENNFLQGSKPDSTTVVSVRGVIDCAVHATSTGGSSFYYDHDTKSCRTFVHEPKSEAKISEDYWINTAKKRNGGNNRGKNTTKGECYRSGLDINWTSDGRCYTVFEKKHVNRIMAENVCKNTYNGTLALLTNEQRFEDTSACLNKYYSDSQPLWIGLTSAGGPGEWVWDNGHNLGEKKPDWPWSQSPDTGDCVCILKEEQWLWRKSPCGVQLAFICEHACKRKR